MPVADVPHDIRPIHGSPIVLQVRVHHDAETIVAQITIFMRDAAIQELRLVGAVYVASTPQVEAALSTRSIPLPPRLSGSPFERVSSVPLISLSA